MEMKFYGNSSNGYFISSEDDGDPLTRPKLLACPICGSEDRLTINNTHTPSFWVECECGCQVHAEEGSSMPYKAADLRNKAKVLAIYTGARDSAVNAWNTRHGSLLLRQDAA